MRRWTDGTSSLQPPAALSGKSDLLKTQKSMWAEEWPQRIGRSCWDLLSLNTITATVAPPLADSVGQLNWVSS